MPSFRKLNPDEIAAAQRPISDRARVAQAYDALLADFALGEYGRAELGEGERRDIVRSQLHAAARRRGLALRFRLNYQNAAAHTLSPSGHVISERPANVRQRAGLAPSAALAHRHFRHITRNSDVITIRRALLNHLTETLALVPYTNPRSGIQSYIALYCAAPACKVIRGNADWY